MQTKYWCLKNDINNEAILQAAKIINAGGTVAFPTETVYGLGADGLSQEAVEKIFAAKGRPADNPLILHVADKKDIYKLAREVPVCAKLLVEKFWPGPLTIIFKKEKHIPDAVTAGLDTVALRMPSNEIANTLIAVCGVPLAAPSANISGKPSPTDAKAVQEDLTGKIDGVIDGGKTLFGLESTVVDCTTPIPVILRPGSITKEQLMQVIEIRDGGLTSEGAKPKAPGMKYRHYAPKAPVYILSRELSQETLFAFCQKAQEENLRIGWIVENSLLRNLPEDVHAYGGWEADGDLAILAQNLYLWLRAFDEGKADLVFVRAVPENDLGAAIMNRVCKAAELKVVSHASDLGKFFQTSVKDL